MVLMTIAQKENIYQHTAAYNSKRGTTKGSGLAAFKENSRRSSSGKRRLLLTERAAAAAPLQRTPLIALTAAPQRRASKSKQVVAVAARPSQRRASKKSSRRAGGLSLGKQRRLPTGGRGAKAAPLHREPLVEFAVPQRPAARGKRAVASAAPHTRRGRHGGAPTTRKIAPTKRATAQKHRRTNKTNVLVAPTTPPRRRRSECRRDTPRPSRHLVGLTFDMAYEQTEVPADWRIFFSI